MDSVNPGSFGCAPTFQAAELLMRWVSAHVRSHENRQTYWCILLHRDGSLVIGGRSS